MKERPPRQYQLWLRLAYVVMASGFLYLSLQFGDLWALNSLAEAGEAGNGSGASAVRPVAYVPVADRPGPQFSVAPMPISDISVAEIGDGGDLGNRAKRTLAEYQPLVFAQQTDDVAYVSLGRALDYLGGELKWAEGQPQATIILPTALVTFAPGQSVAYRNYQEVRLDAPPVAEYGQLRVPIKALGQLCGLKVEPVLNDSLYRASLGGRVLHIIVRNTMYNMEICRGERWLQLFFLSKPIKRYPLCIGAGDNTPVGHFHIQNKAVWPPWNAYWGEYMPGGSSRNPLGARWLGTTAHGRVTGRVIGIHGTNQPSSIGQRISGGCLRTYNNNAIELYNNIPIGTPLYIHE